MNFTDIPSFSNFKKEDFFSSALRIFAWQSQHNTIYQSYLKNIAASSDIKNYTDFPFLPIRIFKSHPVVSGLEIPESFFESSGTGKQSLSRHYYYDLNVYKASFTEGFMRRFGAPQQYCIIGLLPSYLEREHSSLVYMVHQLMQQSQHPLNGFFLYNHTELFELLKKLEAERQPVILFGTTFALLDFSISYMLPLSNTIIIETGGMKGRKEEIIREDLVARLQLAFPLAQIASEYGMTELFSQAYADQSGIYQCPPWMRVLVREEDDPFTVLSHGKGALNIIDLANIQSCSFIATDDVGEVYPDGSFRVLGRLDNSDLRGCSLLVH
ncbi:MAG: acyl transferase [Bacteroidetes bacterium]|nr:acyl transferase [Bacteroidota bacterium]